MHFPQSIGDYTGKKRVPLVPTVATVFFRKAKTKAALFEELCEPDVGRKKAFLIAAGEPYEGHACGIGGTSAGKLIGIIFALMPAVPVTENGTVMPKC
jgi:hypothetical protein